MNRQLRRATEKSDKKREKGRGKRQGARQVTKQRPTQPAQNTKKARREPPEQRSEKATRQQRWAGIYVAMTVVIIALQAVFPQQQVDLISLVIHGLFYLTFGYFLSAWLFRRGVSQALIVALVGGALLAGGVELVKFFRTEVTADLILIYVALPSLLLGALLSRFVYTRTG